MALGLACASPSWATPPDTISTSGPTTTTISADGTTAIPGASATDSTNASQTLLVSVSTTLGSLSLTNTSGLTLSYGYSSFSGPAFSFTGTSADANAALGSLALTGTGTPGAAAISISATANAPGIAYLAANQHYYNFVPTTVLSWTAAQTAANGMSFDGQEGYLATIPNQTIKNFVDGHLNGAQNVWAGGMSIDYPTGNGPDGSHRAWSWAGQTTPGTANYGGPLAGTVFTECTTVSGSCTFLNTDAFFKSTWNDSFAIQEPNNSGYPGTGEHYLEVNYSANPGTWNDIGNTNPVAGYVVEFGDQAEGASSWSGQSTATATVTTAHAPGVPNGLSVGDTTGGQAHVSWNAPDDGGSPITGYLVSATGENGAPNGSCATTAQTTCTITGLAGGALYTFTVSARNAIGTTASSPTSAQIAETTTTSTTPTTVTTPTTPTTPVSPTASACPAASGTFTATTLGSITLGMTRQPARAQLTHTRLAAHGWVRLCLSGGGSSRFAYPSRRLLAALSPSVRSQVRNRVVIALSANPYYALKGIRPGSTLTAARSTLALTRPIRIGTNRWYFTTHGNAVWLLKVHNGHVREIGIVSRTLAATRAAQRQLLRSL